LSALAGAPFTAGAFPTLAATTDAQPRPRACPAAHPTGVFPKQLRQHGEVYRHAARLIASGRVIRKHDLQQLLMEYRPLSLHKKEPQDPHPHAGRMMFYTLRKHPYFTATHNHQ